MLANRFLQKTSWKFALLALLFALGCGQGDPEKIKGEWEILSAIGDGREMSSGGDWFDFQADGTAIVRFSGPEEKGVWRIESEQQTLFVENESGMENRYNYRFSSDSLILKTVVGKSHHLQFICRRKK